MLPITTAHTAAPTPRSHHAHTHTHTRTRYYKLNTGLPGFDKNYFYWFFEARNAPATAPLVLWMTGGPGCSSEVALFGENGPCSVNAGGNDTITNPYSWNTNANLLYIDQPTGTGFSYGTGHDSNEKEVSTDMCVQLQPTIIIL